MTRRCWHFWDRIQEDSRRRGRVIESEIKWAGRRGAVSCEVCNARCIERDGYQSVGSRIEVEGVDIAGDMPEPAILFQRITRRI